MANCLRCGKSLTGKRDGARYCGSTCRKAGFVAKATGTMPGTKRGGARPGAGRPPIKPKPKPVAAPKPKPAKRKGPSQPRYVYTFEERETGATELRYESYEAPIYEYAIRRYEVRKGRERLFVYSYLYEEAALGNAVIGEWVPPVTIPNGLLWVLNRPREKREKHVTIIQKASHWFADFYPSKYFTQEQIESQWRKEREKEREAAEKVEAEKRKAAERDKAMDDFFNNLSGPKIVKAREVLGVVRDATKADIKRAYRRLATEHHPDKGGDRKAFVVIQDAYELLSK